MAEHPILFTGEMVRAILDGRKTQTRRVVKKPKRLEVNAVHPRKTKGGWWWWNDGPYGFCTGSRATCPYGEIGDTLWGRETTQKFGPHWAQYKATLTPVVGDIEHRYMGRAMWWYSRDVCPSIHMPRWAARLLLPVEDIRVERLQDISHEDAIAEGMPPTDPVTVCNLFGDYWNALNAKRGYGWDTNPWVWVIQFPKWEGE